VEIAPGSRILHMEAVEDVRDRLIDQGFRDLSRIKRRGARYFVRGLDPRGDLVALQISIFTGDIERSELLEAGIGAPQPRGGRAASRAQAQGPTRAAPTRPTAAAKPAAPAKAVAKAKAIEPEADDQAEVITKPSVPAKVAKAGQPAPQVQADASGKSGGAASTLKGRLKVPPSDAPAQASKAPPSSDSGSDPLVVY